MNQEDLPLLWAYMRGTWDKFEVPKGELNVRATTMAWMDNLSEYPTDLIRIAVVSLTANPYPPKVGQIREACAKARAAAAGEVGTPSLDEAWAEVKDAVRFVGMYGTPEWSHPVVASTMRAMGWQEFCISEDPEGVLRGNFRHFYEAAEARYKRELVGITPLEQGFRERAVTEGARQILAIEPPRD